MHLAPPWKLSKTPSGTILPPRIELGVDNDYVFRDLLGLKNDELSELEAKGVISKVVTAPPLVPMGALPRQFDRDEAYLDILDLR